MTTEDFENQRAIESLLRLAFAFGEMCATGKWNTSFEIALHHASRNFYARFKDRPASELPRVVG